MARSKPIVPIDFETKGIERRPDYPPEPVGVSIIYPGKRPQYFAWGHPEGNNAEEWQVRERLKDIERSGQDLLFHHAKFDVDVMQTHLGVGPIDWRRIHDTTYLLFLNDPHAKTLSLKPSSEKLLGMPPEEQDKVRDWVLAHKKQIEAEHGKFTPKEFGKFISLAPVSLVGPYANGDTSRTVKLFNHLLPIVRADGMLAAYDRERELMPILLENERLGVRVDLPRLNKDIKVYQLAQEQVETWLRKRLKAPGLDFEKDAQVADALERAGIVTEFVMTKTGKKSVAKDNLTPDMFKDRRVASALGYRNRLQTCLSTFMLPWQRIASHNGGIINTTWNQVRNTDGHDVGARTGRMSCSPNLMNIPTDWYEKNDGYVHPSFLPIPELPMVRNYILGDKGQVFGGRDYNQQELRILAHFEDDKLMAEYQADPMLDVHSFVQEAVSNILGRRIERKPIKILNFGTIYGMGLGKLAGSMGTDVDTAGQINAARRAAMPGVKSLEDGIKKGARENIPIRTWGGRLYYKEEPKVIRGRTVDFGYKLLNYLIQGSAADCTKQSIINYHSIRKEGRFLASVHDENNITAPAKAMKAELKILSEAMADVKFDVAMLSEPYMGKSWGEVAKYKEKA